MADTFLWFEASMRVKSEMNACENGRGLDHKLRPLWYFESYNATVNDFSVVAICVLLSLIPLAAFVYAIPF